MKWLAIIWKSILEQMRHFWILLLTVTMAAFFVAIFYLIYQSEEIHLAVEVVDLDQQELSEGAFSYMDAVMNDSVPIHFNRSTDRLASEERIRQGKTDALLILPVSFSDSLIRRMNGFSTQVPFEISGDISETTYMLAAIYAHSYLSGFISEVTHEPEPYRLTETPMGMSANMDDFSMAIPGLLVLATVLLMFSGAIAYVSEPEKRTMLRLKLSKVNAFSFLGGITTVQVVVGLISILLTLGVAYLFDFTMSGSSLLFILVCILTCLSVLGFGLILAGVTKSANEVLIVGNFPLFLFMFFSGTVFPIHGTTLFSFAGYDVTLPGLLSTYHGVEALKKITIFNSGFAEIWPELTCLVALSVIYFAIGYWIYRRRHMRVF